MSIRPINRILSSLGDILVPQTHPGDSRISFRDPPNQKEIAELSLSNTKVKKIGDSVRDSRPQGLFYSLLGDKIKLIIDTANSIKGRNLDVYA